VGGVVALFVSGSLSGGWTKNGAWLAESGHRTCARKAGAAVGRIWRRLLAALVKGRAWQGRAYRKALRAVLRAVPFRKKGG